VRRLVVAFTGLEYDYLEDQWLMESTATWIESRFAPDVNANQMYLPYGQLRAPARPLDRAEGRAVYGNWVFFQYLAQRHGVDVVRRIWDQAANNKHSVQAVRFVLNSGRGGFADNYSRFASWNTTPSAFYRNVDWRPKARIAATRTLRVTTRRQVAYQTRFNHLAARNLDIRIHPERLAGDRWRVRLRVDGPAKVTSPRVRVLIHLRNGRVIERKVALRGTGTGTSRGSIGLSVRRGEVRNYTVTLANASTRYRDCGSDTPLACGGYSRDNGQLFKIRAELQRTS
jgi:hypothetical protein